MPLENHLRPNSAPGFDEEPMEWLVDEGVDAVRLRGPAALDALCAAHPECAAGLRAAVQAALGERAGEAPGADARAQLGQLGRLRLIEWFGAGSTGVVYLAEEPSLGRAVAVKLLQPELLAASEARERFRRDLQVLAGLHHAALLRVFSFGDEQGIPFYTREMQRGCKLSAALGALSAEATPGEPPSGRALAEAAAAAASDRSLGASDFAGLEGDWPEVCARLARELAEGLEHAHAHGVLHLNVAASNVALAPGGRALLFDFGLPPGTEGSAAPELSAAGGAPDARSDVFALGALLVELLALGEPGAGAELPARLAAGEPSQAGLEPFAPALRRALAADPGERWATAGDFARALGRALEGADGTEPEAAATEPAAEAPAPEAARPPAEPERDPWADFAPGSGSRAAADALDRAAAPVDLDLDLAAPASAAAEPDPPARAELEPERAPAGSWAEPSAALRAEPRPSEPAQPEPRRPEPRHAELRARRAERAPRELRAVGRAARTPAHSGLGADPAQVPLPWIQRHAWTALAAVLAVGLALGWKGLRRFEAAAAGEPGLAQAAGSPGLPGLSGGLDVPSPADTGAGRAIQDERSPLEGAPASSAAPPREVAAPAQPAAAPPSAASARAQASDPAEQAGAAEGLDPRVLEFLAGLFGPSDQMAGPARPLGARELLERGQERLGALGSGPSLERAHVASFLGQAYLQLGDPAAAEAPLREALASWRASGAASERTLPIVLALLDHCIARARWDDAAELCAEILGDLDEARAAGAPEPDPALASELVQDLEAVAAGLAQAGRHDQARGLLARALDVSRAALGEDHLDTLHVLNGLATLLDEQGRYEEALPLYRLSLEQIRARYGERHEYFVYTASNLALLCDNMQRPGEAEPLYEEALERALDVFGEDDRSTFVCIDNLAGFYTDQGRHAEASELYERALVGWNGLLGDEDEATLSTVFALGRSYLEQGRYSEAEPLLADAFQSFQYVFGDADVQTLASLAALIEVYERQKRYGEAESLARVLLARTPLDHAEFEARAELVQRVTELRARR